ncbi:MAG: hypothetical protein ACYDA4_13335 [Ignavibacteriaceae bacterium]
MNFFKSSESVKEKYLLTKESYRPLAEAYLNKKNPRTEESKQRESYKMMVDLVTDRMYDNYVDKFTVHYFLEHPELDMNEFLKSFDNEKELQKYINTNFSNLREILEGYALSSLTLSKKQ